MTRTRAALLLAAATSCFSAPAFAKGTAIEATITRTTYGIPHIKAKDFRGLGFGAAYIAAQDNVCTMADAYVTVAGERSRYYGADSSFLMGSWTAKNIDSDFFYRTVLDTRAIERAMTRSTPDYKDLLAGYVAGYNHFLKEHAGRLPAACAGQPWVRPITQADVLRWINGFALFASTTSMASGIADAAPGSEPAKKAAQVQTDGTLHALGSNGWAFGGDTTANGRGVVIGNPHFPWTGAYRFYELHMTIPGRFDVAGATILGQPYIGIGFNKDVAWTHTVDTAVHATMMKLALDPADPTVYLIDGKREKMTRRKVTVAVKDSAPITRTMYATRYGPMVSLPDVGYGWTRGTAYAVKDANRDNIRGGDSWIAMGKARRVADLRDALVRYRGVGFLNTIAADRTGDAMHATITPAPNVSDAQFAACGTIGKHELAFFSQPYVLDGSKAACDWQAAAGQQAPGLLPGEKMFALTRRDYVQNSNDSYRWTNIALPPIERGVMLGKEYGGETPSMRTRSGLTEIALLLKAGKIDPAKVSAAILGNKNFAGQLVLPQLLELCKRPAAPTDGCAALAKWDGKEELTSRGSLLFQVFWRLAGDNPAIWRVPFDPAKPVTTPTQLVTDGPVGDALVGALTAATAALESYGLPLDAPLGKVQGATRITAAGPELIPISGGAYGGTLNYIAAAPVAGHAEVLFGSSYIQAVTFDETGPRADAVLTFSQSTDPASPYYADQTRAFSKKQLRRFPFTEAEIAADAVGAAVTIRQ